jgi:hypothetical protein
MFTFDNVLRGGRLRYISPQRDLYARPEGGAYASDRPLARFPVPAALNGIQRRMLNCKREVVMKWAIGAVGLILLCADSAAAQKLGVKIIIREDKEDEYDYAAVYDNVAAGKSFKVHGATFTLQLPDGRLVTVNCESKFAEHMAGPVGNRRSCRTPLVDSIQADFHGDKAKLIWPVSLDGKKMQSETYKILGILDKPKSN